jgi:HK97 gp10 family phage protein
MIDFDFDPSVKKLVSELEKLETDLQNKAQKAGLRRAALPIKQQMKQNAPSRTGRLKKSITHNVLSGKRKETAYMLAGKGQKESTKLNEGQHALIVGPNRKVKGINPSYYGHILEFGAKNHQIQIRKKNKGKTLRMYATSGGVSNFFYSKGKVNHPGVNGLGWMSKSHDQAASKVQTHFYQGLSRYLDKQKSVKR